MKKCYELKTGFCHINIFQNYTCKIMTSSLINYKYDHVFQNENMRYRQD